MWLNLEVLESRDVPTTAVLSNGLLFVQGDNLGNNISVYADANSTIHVSERGSEVSIFGTPASLTSVKSIVEQAGTGVNNTLATASSLGGIPNTLLGNGVGTCSLLPGNNAPSFALGSPNSLAVNYFKSNPGGKDVFVGGNGKNLFDWEPGTGSDVYIGVGTNNTVFVLGNNNNIAEQDALTSNSQAGTIYQRLGAPAAFRIDTTGIQNWVIEPSFGFGNSVLIGNLQGTATKQVDVYQANGVVDTSADYSSTLVKVHGQGNIVNPGNFGVFVDNQAPISVTTLLANLVRPINGRVTPPR